MIAANATAGKKIAVMGLGKSGLATLASLRAGGAEILAWDDNEAGRKAAESAGFPLTDLTKTDWKTINSLILSPGIPHTYPAPHPVAQLAKEHGVEIIGDIELLFRAPAKAQYVGITGTNGKSTTTALIAHIIKTATRPVAVGGNLGMPVLAFDPQPDNGHYVIEMSSYQCELTPSAAFDIGIWLNITPDHIDRHGNLEGYIAAKRKMFREAEKNQTMIVAVDDEYSIAVADTFEKTGHWQITRISSQRVLAKGVSAMNGALYVDGREVFSYAKTSTLPGAHNAQNIAAATATALALGLDANTILKSILTYPGLPHRQQLVRTIGKVRYINDSKATNADAAGKALGCYPAIYWIAGGKPKEGGLSGLEPFMPAIRHAFLIGAASDDFANWLEGKAANTKCEALERAVQQASAMAGASADKEPVVLLSPACASFDQFKSYEHRGEEFARLVSKLSAPPVSKAS
jgi:UDP-N-acetylmuramoylalanine--D-glutamate ligase